MISPNQLQTNILYFLRQCAPHHRDREWYKLLDEAQHLLGESGGEADAIPVPRNLVGQAAVWFTQANA